MEGKVLRIPTEAGGRRKGFGFVSSPDGVDRFFHASSCKNAGGFDALNVGDHVSFDEDDGEKGPRADNIRSL